jgi:hypothetical protein
MTTKFSEAMIRLEQLKTVHIIYKPYEIEDNEIKNY